MNKLMAWFKNFLNPKDPSVPASPAPPKPVEQEPAPVAPAKPPVSAEPPPKKEEKKAPTSYWMVKAKKFDGKGEHDKSFVAMLASYWYLVGLRKYNTLIGSSFAWCGLFVAFVLYSEGLPFQKNGAGAKNWREYGQEVQWRVNGVPKGAIVQINHNLKCGSSSGNHVAFADGDCAAKDLVEMVKGSDGVYRAVVKKGATINLFGGNQGNKAKTSTYPVAEICAVRYPPGVQLPGKIEKSVNCTSGKSGKESTR